VKLSPNLLTRRQLCASLVRKSDGKERHMQAYCMKCRTKVEIKNPKSIKMKNGKPATQGVCPKCGTKVFRIGKG
jgi:DNA-directed RNA polymerase subunit RPC12/RpoP